MGSIDLELEGDAADGLCEVSRRAEQGPTETLPAALGNDVELVEPRDEPAVLERPRIGHHCHAHRNIAIEPEEKGAALGHFDEARDGGIEALR